MGIPSHHKNISPFPGIAAKWRFLLAWIAYGSWFLYATPFMKILSIGGATFFSIIEFLWYSMSVELPDGSVVFKPWAPNVRKGHTTFTQWAINILYLPFFWVVYQYLIPDWRLRILLFPFNIWLCEIIEGYILMFLFGYNPAWVYRGPLAFFHGNITLSYWIYWQMLGVPVEFGTHYLLAPVVAHVGNW